MSKQIPILEYVKEVIQANRFAVLATECDGQPYASLLAVTATNDYLKLIFATYRNTRKYANLIQNGKIAILFENRGTNKGEIQNITVLTALGQAEEINCVIPDMDMKAHLLRHPELEKFLLSAECAVFRMKVNAYQIVKGIDDSNWWNIGEFDTLS